MKVNLAAPALARYEHDLTTKVLSGEVETFSAADHEGVYTHLGAENLTIVAELRAEIAKLKGGSNKGSRGSKKKGGGGHPRCPEDRYLRLLQLHLLLIQPM